MSKIIKKCSVASSVFLFSMAMSFSSEASMSKEQIQVSIEKQYAAKVLNISQGKDMGRSVFFVKIMFTGGNYNTAFQVNTIVIDSNTGKRLPQFRHGPSGRRLSGSYDASPNRQSPGALRGHIWR
jgi:hypothetical protein